MDFQKEINLNKRILVILIMLSVLTIGMYSSYALFEKKETYNNVLKIQTGAELPLKGLVGATKDLANKENKEDDGLYGMNPETGELCEQSDCNEYRYSGPKVKNYVKLINKDPSDLSKSKEELWRIIGIFTDEDTGEKYLRIVRNELLSNYNFPEKYKINGVTYRLKYSSSIAENNDERKIYWNVLEDYSRNPSWAPGGLQLYLNTQVDENGTKGYMSFLNDDTLQLLTNREHYLGSLAGDQYSDNIDTVIAAYQHERDIKECVNNTTEISFQPGCFIYINTPATWNGQIGLMYPSDYGFSASKQYWTAKLYGTNSPGTFSDATVNGTSWMYATMPDIKELSSLLITTPIKYAGTSANRIDTRGYVYGTTMSDGLGVRPVLNLKSDVKITNLDIADGSLEKPYELGF